ncbi:MAG: class I SAM-dependent methyltransferase [Sporomusaceae bacterium]|nr:class I SAM-dependent methyltransferase [Sporomusaceae bacterium]
MQKDVLDNQHSHWENNFTIHSEMFGEMPSESAQKAVEIFRENGISKIIELGGGQGRDTIYFAQKGFQVYMLDYTDTGVEIIRHKAESLGLSHLITATKHDVRNTLPFDDETFDACFSHMLYCMAFTTQELQQLSEKVRQVLKPNAINIYTVRNTEDAHYGTGLHRGENMYEANGFIVHFFNQKKIELLANGYDIIDITRFEEGDLPRKLFRVTSRRQK